TEENFIQSVAGQTMDHPDMPIQAVLEIPAWLQESFQARFGGALADEMQALNQPAPVDLRVNTLKGTRKETQASLAGNGIVTEETPFSPLGLRLQGRVKLDATEAYKSGLIEIQDEGSQLAALLSAALAGQTVFDVCAGAGGKTLALAASMNNLGLLIACDTLERRLKRLAPRLRRSGATLIETRVLKEVAEPWMVDDTAVADRVLVDAPCSGSGAWRRHPEARWRLTREDLDGLIASQRTILAGAAKLVKPGGRLIYVTCSLLEEENETQADGFLNAHKDFTCIPAPKVWAETIGGTAPFDGPYALLTPARHGTDGFFIAVFEKVA
ncbi:MAG: RsmB/NOP family class I SAM-dependent RNA methyltransferase, partial [Rhodospirillales bacterium]|nr:RsmB/NOP family class I SAM-dependent RNA methyltransferase [Rhodospirillales bacterium]